MMHVLLLLAGCPEEEPKRAHDPLKALEAAPGPDEWKKQMESLTERAPDDVIRVPDYGDEEIPEDEGPKVIHRERVLTPKPAPPPPTSSTRTWAPAPTTKSKSASPTTEPQAEPTPEAAAPPSEDEPGARAWLPLITEDAGPDGADDVVTSGELSGTPDEAEVE